MVRPLPNHPWRKGTRLVSVQGERDDDDGTERHTGPYAVGIVETVHHYPSQGWTYGVGFPSSGVFVYLDENDPLEDVTRYRAAEE